MNEIWRPREQAGKELDESIKRNMNYGSEIKWKWIVNKIRL